MDASGNSRFIDEAIEVEFDSPPARQKTPSCPQGFTWNGQVFHIVESLAEWGDFTRRGRSERNMRPAHASAAASHGSLGVGRFFFRVRTQDERVFEIYYDRAPKDASHMKGAWFIYRELISE